MNDEQQRTGMLVGGLTFVGGMSLAAGALARWADFGLLGATAVVLLVFGFGLFVASGWGDEA